MRKIRELNTDIYVEEQGDNIISLLQSPKRAVLSSFYSDAGKVNAIINCSYFTSSYVLGRNQGDLYNEAPDQDFYSVVVRKDNSYGCAKYASWDEKENIVAGFSPAVVLIKDGKDVELISGAISGAKSRLTTKNPNTAFGFKKDGKAILVVNEGRTSNDSGLTGRELRTVLKKYYNLDLLVLLDGGGSSEMIVNGKIVNTLSDGSQRAMFNGIAFIDNPNKEDPVKEIAGVKRDETKNQLKIVADSIRARKNHSTSSDVVGIVKKDNIYNNLESYKDASYTWYRIGTNQWIADSGSWVTLLPKKDTSADTIKNLQAQVSQLTKENTNLANEKAKLITENTSLKGEISNLTKEVKTLSNRIASALATLA